MRSFVCAGDMASHLISGELRYNIMLPRRCWQQTRANPPAPRSYRPGDVSRYGTSLHMRHDAAHVVGVRPVVAGAGYMVSLESPGAAALPAAVYLSRSNAARRAPAPIVSRLGGCGSGSIRRPRRSGEAGAARSAISPGRRRPKPKQRPRHRGRCCRAISSPA